VSDRDLPELPPDITALLGAARDVPAAPGLDRRRVAARLALTTGLAVPAATFAGTKVVAAAWLAKAAAVALLATATVAVGVALAPPPRRRPAAAAAAAPARVAPAPQPSVAPAPAPVAAVAPVVAPVVAPPAAVARAVAPPVVDDTSLERELALIARAHAALARGALDDAGDALARHARLHPRGRLRPEREALMVQRIAAGGDRDAARAARERFHARFPASMLGAAVDRAVDEMPAP
jgi:hypothetical protein